MARQPKPWRRRQGGAWYTTIDRRQIRLAPAGATKEAAWDALKALLGGSRPPAAVSARPSFRDAANAFLARQATRVESGQIVAGTLEHYATLLSLATIALGTQPAEEMTPDAVLSWAGSQKRWGPARCRAGVQAVRSAIRHATRAGLIGRDPLAGMKPPPGTARDFDATADIREQVRAVATDEAWGDFLLACELSGCRPGEVAAVTALEFDAAAGTWTVPNKTRWSTGQTHRTVYLPPALAQLCQKLAQLRPTGPLFLNSQNRPWKRWAWGGRMRRARAKLGLSSKLVTYSLRAAFCSDAIEANVNPVVIAELMGHRDLNMIQKHYSRIAQRRQILRDAVAAIRPGVGKRRPK